MDIPEEAILKEFCPLLKFDPRSVGSVEHYNTNCEMSRAQTIQTNLCQPKK